MVPAAMPAQVGSEWISGAPRWGASGDQSRAPSIAWLGKSGQISSFRSVSLDSPRYAEPMPPTGVSQANAATVQYARVEAANRRCAFIFVSPERAGTRSRWVRLVVSGRALD